MGAASAPLCLVPFCLKSSVHTGGSCAPSLSLRLRSVRYDRADSDVLRTRSNRVRPRSVCISLQFECGMTKFAASP